jgi:phosphate butyryltransferase
MEEFTVLTGLNDLVKKAKASGKTIVSVAVAQDREILIAIKMAYDEGIADAILVGDADKIKPMTREVGLPEDIRVIDEKDEDKAALIAVGLVHDSEAQVLVKGIINTSNFLRAALNKEKGLRTGNILNHFAGFEIPGARKLLFQADGGMNIAPTLEEKKGILINTVRALHAMGIEKPKVGILTANEQVNPKMPATLDAKALVEMAAEGEFPDCIVEGPIAMDVAVSAEAARRKGIKSEIAGDVDLLLCPNIEAGNVMGKTLVHFAGARMAGGVLGATHPIVLVSRSDDAESKLYSIAMACVIARGMK